MKIAYLATVWDPSDIRDEMGVTHFIAKGLRFHGHEVTIINLRDKHKGLTLFFKLVRSFFTGKPSLWPAYSKRVNRLYQREIEKGDYDIIFTFGFLPYSYLESPLPKLCWTDGTFEALLGFHPFVRGWGKKFVQWAGMLDKQGADNCDHLIFSSEWARSSYLYKMGGKLEKTSLIPFGANIPEEPLTEEVDKAISQRLETDEIRLLFIGLKWEAKGGLRLLEIARGVRELGHSVRLDIVGLKPDIPEDLRDCTYLHGFVSKKDPEGWKLLKQLYLSAHFYVMPSEGETYGHVYCEASAFGVPSIAYDIAGASEIIRDGKNGKAFPTETKMELISNYIVNTFSSRENYKELAHSSHREYHERLSWPSAYRDLGKVLERFTPRP
jgi:glycosyltransferase involved in cell wall biosynthesis